MAGDTAAVSARALIGGKSLVYGWHGNRRVMCCRPALYPPFWTAGGTPVIISDHRPRAGEAVLACWCRPVMLVRG
jgi:hypothetical protein